MDETAEVVAEGYGLWPVLTTVACVCLVYYFFCKPPARRTVVIPTIPGTPHGNKAFTGGGKKTLVQAAQEGKNLLILYGTQTGTAEDFSNRLSQEARRNAIDPMVSDIAECEYEDMAELAGKNVVVMFVVATYGEGEPTDNAVEFLEWLTNLNDGDLAGVKYTVLGLGNKTYTHYQFMGRNVTKHMERCGGECVFRSGECDEDGNMEDDFTTWQEELWPALCERLGVDPTTASQAVQRIYQAKEHTPAELAAQEEREFSRQKTQVTYDAKRPALVPVKTKYELHKARSERSCLHVEFDLKGTRVKYTAGDHLGILPENDPELVDGIIARLGVADPDKAISMAAVEQGGKPLFVGPVSIRTALLRCVDLVIPPRKNVLQILADYATDAGEKAALLELASNKSPEHKRRYAQHIVTDQRSISDVLREFRSVQIPIDHFLELMPKLQVRYYSISSSPKADATVVSVTAAVVGWVTKAGTPRKGVCTNYLKRLELGERARVFVRKSSFRLPAPEKPVIMIGPGTGLAPFRGFLQDRRADAARGVQVGPALLFFGCRRRDEDFIYEDELNDYRSDNTLSNLHVAFSRESAGAKEYVQTLLVRDAVAEEVGRMLGERKGHLYVCGDAKAMAHDVRAAVVQLLQRHGGVADAVAAEAWLEKSKQFQQDVW